MNETGRAWALVSAAMWLLALPAMAGPSDLPGRFGRCHEREITGDLAGALAGYRDLLQAAMPSEPLLAEKILYRIGLCERANGRPEAARRAWRQLVEEYPARDPEVVRTRDELKLLEQELDRVEVSGRVAGEQGLSPAFIHAGEWGDEPVALADTSGVFRVQRKVAGQGSDGRRYSLVFAEHPQLPRVAAALFREAGGVATQQLVRIVQSDSGEGLQLVQALSLLGRVVDTLGRPVAGALVEVTAYDHGIPLPFNRIVPPVVSSPGGDFQVSGLVPGLRYVLTAVKPNCRLVTPVELDTADGTRGREGVALSCGSIVVRKLGEISLRGRIMDESGTPVRADVAAWSLPPVEREVAHVSSDPDGRFILRDVHENTIAIRVAGDGYLPRQVTGIKPMGQDVDIVVRGNGLSGASPVNPARLRETAPLFEPEGVDEGAAGLVVTLPSSPFPVEAMQWIRGNSETGAPLSPQELAGHVVVWHFGSAYVDAALRARYPSDPGNLLQIMRLYGDEGVVVIWVLPAGESGGDAVRVAVELCPGVPLAILSKGAGKSPASPSVPVSVEGLDSGNVVVGRSGLVRTVCSDQQLFKAVKAAVLAR